MQKVAAGTPLGARVPAVSSARDVRIAGNPTYPLRPALDFWITWIDGYGLVV